MTIDVARNNGSAFEGLYHVTAHGVGRERIFRDSRDKREFLTRFRNHLDREPIRNSSRHLYAKLHDEVSLVTFGVLDDHFHVILREIVEGGMRRLMRRTQIGYAQYFNRRHRRRGPIFDRRFEPTPIVDLQHARFSIAYVHLNHVVDQLDHEFVGHRTMYAGDRRPWIASEIGLNMFGGRDGYRAFLNREGPAIVDRKLVKYDMCRETYKYRPIA